MAEYPKLTKLSKISSARNARLVETCALQLGHSFLHFLKLSLMQSPQNRWPHSGMICASSVTDRQIGHSSTDKICWIFSSTSVGDGVDDKDVEKEDDIVCFTIVMMLFFIFFVRRFLCYEYSSLSKKDLFFFFSKYPNLRVHVHIFLDNVRSCFIFIMITRT